jgi:hypothetical protein
VKRSEAGWWLVSSIISVGIRHSPVTNLRSLLPLVSASAPRGRTIFSDFPAFSKVHQLSGGKAAGRLKDVACFVLTRRPLTPEAGLSCAKYSSLFEVAATVLIFRVSLPVPNLRRKPRWWRWPLRLLAAAVAVKRRQHQQQQSQLLPQRRRKKIDLE